MGGAGFGRSPRAEDLLLALQMQAAVTASRKLREGGEESGSALGMCRCNVGTAACVDI